LYTDEICGECQIGPTQAALAEQFAVTWNTVARRETGQRRIPELAVRLLACLAPSGSNERDPESERLWVCSSAVRARAGLATVASTAGRAVFAVSASAGQVDGPNIRSKAEADAALDDLRTAIKGRHPR
jgi:hypothetical protein